MKEIGGYFELDTYRFPMLHDGAVALNCGRNALAYLIEARNIKKVRLPYFLCSSVKDLCNGYKVSVHYYHIGWNFQPEEMKLEDNEWLYLVNYYGQLSKEIIRDLCAKYKRIIVDYAQDYFAEPISGVDTIFTCRKYFGVSDGAFLYTDAELGRVLERDESFARMEFVLGRYERSAGDFYTLSAANNKLFAKEPIKQMSRLTENLLHGIDYEFVKKRRIDNFKLLHKLLGNMNELKIVNDSATFMYPLLIKNGTEIRKKMQSQKIFIPTLWPNVLNDTAEGEIEYRMATDILPLPCDHRYDREDMEYITNLVFKEAGNESIKRITT